MNRAELMLAFRGLLRAGTVAERGRAGKEASRAIEAYLNSTEGRTEAGGDDLPREVVERKIAPFGDRDAPLRRMSDAQLADFNELLPWAAKTFDPQGRVVGESWSGRKRTNVARLVEQRHEAFDQVLPLAGRHVLEVGCFEGIHSISLILLGATVTGADARVENLVKTMTRAWAYGLKLDPVLWDLEAAPPPDAPQAWDVLHHIGVLYHQTNPVESLTELLARTRHGLLLDTHVAESAAEAGESYEVDGTTYRYARRAERHVASSPFAGTRDHAKYLVVEEMMALIGRLGFPDVRLVDDRAERNGRRITLWAFREGLAR